jgi:hypothetical protein
MEGLTTGDPLDNRHRLSCGHQSRKPALRIRGDQRCEIGTAQNLEKLPFGGGRL